VNLSDKQLAALSAMVRGGHMTLKVVGNCTYYEARNRDLIGIGSIVSLERMGLAKRMKRGGVEIVVPTSQGQDRYSTQLSTGLNVKRRIVPTNWRDLTTEEKDALRAADNWNALFWDRESKAWTTPAGHPFPRAVVSKLARLILLVVEPGMCARITPQGRVAIDVGKVAL
jgi:hypothetical protein